ncbi:MAG: hypothetical protein ABR589_11710 [Chthoniobacterales bacterium]
MGSRDLRRIYGIDPKTWSVIAVTEAPGIPWAAVSTGDSLWFTLGEGAEDDRYLRRYKVRAGFAPDKERIPCPEFTGSYLSYDGENLYLSQWYKHRILELSSRGRILRTIEVGAEISGHTYVDGWFYVLCGTEKGEEDWRIARLDPQEETPRLQELARVPFQCRSLAFDGKRFWSNHRAADTIVAFNPPKM